MCTHHQEESVLTAMSLRDRTGKLAKLAGGENVGQRGEEFAKRGADPDRCRELPARDLARKAFKAASARPGGIEWRRLHRAKQRPRAAAGAEMEDARIEVETSGRKGLGIGEEGGIFF